ncbi:hypothetical protein QUA74_02660 [Microcoleus sp. LAD1_D3]|uniref:hypothetical protein n=1 Tax=Microcoleus sp. LAD1_D3 TaxID=2819365 RepID=UPI002FD471DA
MKASHKKKWLKIIEFTVVGVATWLNPHAGFLLFLLRLCFQILAALQKDEVSETDKDEQPTRCLRSRNRSYGEGDITRRSLPHTPVQSTKQ